MNDLTNDDQPTGTERFEMVLVRTHDEIDGAPVPERVLPEVSFEEGQPYSWPEDQDPLSGGIYEVEVDHDHRTIRVLEKLA